MLFRNCEHYDLHDTSQGENDNECLRECCVCYELNDIENQVPVKLDGQSCYLKKCTCDVLIHLSCLHAWYESSKTCPICRKEMIYYSNKRCIFYLYYLISKHNNKILKFYICIICFYYLFKDVRFIMEVADLLYLIRETEFF
jgi:hypothetical protein